MSLSFIHARRLGVYLVSLHLSNKGVRKPYEEKALKEWRQTEGVLYLHVFTEAVASLMTKALSLLVSLSAGKTKKPFLFGVYP
jgi:hypothetical protein